MKILAIDPGNLHSGWCILDTDDYRPVEFGKTDNESLLGELIHAHWKPRFDAAVIEMIASYGMPVGAEVFATCVWIGRYLQTMVRSSIPVTLTERKAVKLHLCGSSRAKDANITQALVDRFALGQPGHGKGTKAAPGWFHGFHADVWAAYALAVTHADTTRDSWQTLWQIAHDHPGNSADTPALTWENVGTGYRKLLKAKPRVDT